MSKWHRFSPAVRQFIDDCYGILAEKMAKQPVAERKYDEAFSQRCDQCSGKRYTDDGLPCSACNAMGESPPVQVTGQ